VYGTAALGDETYFGFLRSIDPVHRTVDFDVAQHFLGDAAHQAQRDDGAEQHDGYVRNQSGLVRTLAVSPAVVVTVARCAQPVCIGQYLGTFNGLVASFGATSNSSPNYGDEYRGAHSQYWVTVSGGDVTRIDEQYQS
jgi:hypothetical protein